MARILKHKDTPQPGVWHMVRGDFARTWRKNTREKLTTQSGVSLEFSVTRQENIDEAPGTHETGVVEAPAKEKPRQPLETVEELARMMVENILAQPHEGRIRRIQLLKANSGMGHLTDEEALDQLTHLAHKLARRDAERRYKEMNLLAPARIGQTWGS